MPFGVSEIYQEGLQIPPLRIFAEGQIDEALYSLINQNVRTRHEVRGDLMAQYACASIGQQRIDELLARQNADQVIPYMNAILDYAERRMRAAIATLPDGTYCFEDFLDDDGVSDEPVKIALTLTIAGENLHADFTGTDQQVLGLSLIHI